MSDSLLSQDEIQALIKQLQADDAPEADCSEDESVQEPEYRPVQSLEATRATADGMARTSKVVFAALEPNLNIRKGANLTELSHVNFDLSIVLGEAVLTVGELLNLKEDSVISLDRLAGENVSLLVNEKALADGEIVVLNDCFALRVSSLLGGYREPQKPDVEGEEETQ